MILKTEVMIDRIRRRIRTDTLEISMNPEDEQAFVRIEQKALAEPLDEEEFDQLEGLYEMYVESLA